MGMPEKGPLDQGLFYLTLSRIAVITPRVCGVRVASLFPKAQVIPFEHLDLRKSTWHLSRRTAAA
jgi:hypothetical protein